jgi:sulfate adenylyltransferase
MSENNSIQPHGGVLVNRITKVDTTGLFSITITEDLANDVENIADGIFSPLEGFLGKQDFESVVSRGRLANDLAWTIPIVLDVDENTASKMKEAGNVLLQNPDGIGIAVLHVSETFSFDKEKTAQGVYGTTDSSHPGVAYTMSMQDFLVGGKIDYLQRPNDTEIRKK